MYQFIYFPFHDYKKWEKEGFRTRDSHFFQELSIRKDVDKVLVINRPTAIYEKLLGNTTTKTGQVIYTQKDYRLKKINDKVFVLDYFPLEFISPLVYKKNWWSKTYNSKKFIEIVDEVISFLKLNNEPMVYSNVVINSNITNHIKKKYKNSKIIFDLVDDQSKIETSSVYLESINLGYGIYAETADILIGTSSSLSNKVNKEIIEITNGVDINHFKKNNGYKKNLVNIDTTKILYTGKIHKRIDFTLLEELLKTFKKVSFIFCGPILGQTPFKKLEKKYNNLIWLGDVHYNDLPDILNEADICIIPHLNNELTKSQSPLKLLEYLAANKPVITTSINGTSSFDTERVFVADNVQEFIKGIKKFLNVAIEKDDFIIPDTELWSYKTNLIIEAIEEHKKG